MTAHDPRELYVTEAEQEAYDLGAQCALGNVRTHVEARMSQDGSPFYVVMVESLDAVERGRRVRRTLFGS